MQATNTDTVDSSESAGDVDIAQARRAAYGLIAHGFQYPQGDAVESMADPGRWSAWPEVLHRVAPEATEKLAAVRAIGQCSAPDTTSCLAERQDSFNHIFGHAVRSQCPPYELEYGRGEIIQQASFLADVGGFYNAFGMEVDPAVSERGDHISVEAEFMSALCAKEAHAIAQGDADHCEIAVKAQRDFLLDHLARWIPAFADRVRKADPRSFYGVLAEFSAAFIETECRRLEIPSGPPTLELRPVDSELDTSINCGSSSGGAGDEIIELNVDSQAGSNA